MHIVHLAVAIDAISSVLIDLVDLGLTSLKALWENYWQWCEDGGPYRWKQVEFKVLLSSHAPGIPDRASHRFFTNEVLRPGGGTKYVEISQKICSATACRYMIFWTRSVVDHVKATDVMAMRFGHVTHPFNFQTVFHKMMAFFVTSFCPRYRVGIMAAFATMESLMLRGARWLTRDAHEEFVQAYLVMRTCLNNLAEHACASGLARYHMRPKVHMLSRLIWNFLPRNPRYYSCYVDEDFIARSKRVAEVSHPVHVSRLALQRYIIEVCMRFAGVEVSRRR